MVADGIVGLYHRAPYPLRVAVASARGAQLTRLRYGRETDELVQAALDRDRWPVDRLQAWQDERLAAVLAHAHRAVPAHRARWAELRRSGRGGDPTALADWPVLSKADVRAAGAALRADTATGRLWEEHTSGSTGTPVHVWQTRAAVRAWYALIEARLRRWNGVDRSDRWAMVGGQLVARPGSESPPWWVWNAGQHQLYLSALDISPRTAAAYAAAMHDHGVRYLHGYPSAMHALATSIERAGAVAPQLAVALSNAEPLLDHQRDAIGRVFGCAVRDTYGMTELVAGASECEAGSLHLWPEAGVVEVVDDDGRPCPPGTAGRVLCTGLLNDAMPLVRYEVGDRAAIGADPCPCGRTLPVLAAIEGRLDDVVVGVDGRLVGRLDHVFKADVPVAEAQIVQHALGEFEIRVVPAPGWDDAHGRALAGRLRDRVGDASVTITVVDALERGANGKLRAVISAVAADRTTVPGTAADADRDHEGGIEVSTPHVAEILVVCTANRVRSPMAAAMLARACAETGVPVRISSAGLLRGGHPADPTAVSVAQERGLDLRAHVSREVRPDLLQASDLVIVMTRDHLRQLAVLEPSAFVRTFTLPELARGVVDLPVTPAPLRERVAALSAGRSARGLLGERPQDDVVDPMGGPVEGYRILADELTAWIAPIATALTATLARPAPAPEPTTPPGPPALHARPLPKGMPAPPSIRTS